MFKRFTGILIALFIISIFTITLYWTTLPETELYSNTPVTAPYRISQDFGGKWESYSSLREAWNSENRTQDARLSFLPSSQEDSVIIPSNTGLDVIAKKFSVTGKWSYKTAQLVIEGVYGNVDVYLNGMDEVHFLGKIEGNGGLYTLNFSPSRFDFSNENILILQVSKNSIDQNKTLGWLWPEKGKITGQIHLQAVCETTIDLSKIAVDYDPVKKQVATAVTIIHHDLLEQGPWAIKGVLMSNGQKIAECTLPLNANGTVEQEVKLIFSVADAHNWSTQDPFLYELDLELINNRGDIDTVQLPVGIRHTGNTKVEGQIISHNQEYLISNKQQVEVYLTSLKNSGKNTVYFMGFFPNESWLYAADKLGINVWLEIPVSLTASSKLPDPAMFDELIALSAKHPSVMAWTLAKALESSQASTSYLQTIGDKLQDFPRYHLVYVNSPEVSSEVIPIGLSADGLSGDWGHLEYLADGTAQSDKSSGVSNWKVERVIAILWLVWLIFVSVQSLISFKWKYKELSNDSPKKSIRKACFWCCIALASRMATLGVFITFLIYHLPVVIPSWLPYDMSWLEMVKNIPPAAVTFCISFLLICLRLLQVGVAASAFPQNPDALGLTCWMERKYGWTVLFGVAIILMVYGLPFYIPIAVYLVLSLIFLPVRIRDVWKAGGKYSRLLVVPGTILLVILAICAWRYPDFVYLYKTILPNISLPFNI